MGWGGRAGGQVADGEREQQQQQQLWARTDDVVRAAASLCRCRAGVACCCCARRVGGPHHQAPKPVGMRAGGWVGGWVKRRMGGEGALGRRSHAPPTAPHLSSGLNLTFLLISDSTSAAKNCLNGLR